jgi:PhnB protein
VQIVDLADVVDARHRASDAVRVDALRCGLEEDAARGSSGGSGCSITIAATIDSNHATNAMMCTVATDLQPELWVENTASAVDYYRRAFGAIVEHRVGADDDADGVVQLSVGGARFWVSGASAQMGRFAPAAIGGATGRLLLVVEEPVVASAAAVAAGGRLTSEVAEEHGWLLGRLVDPFGHEWEIGRPLGAWPPPSDPGAVS